jgi:class 3 adenylate cyclase/tetratricopeptide (TPR) repeat protein
MPSTSTLSDEMPSPNHSEDERRQLTVMFCDLVGSTSLSERLDAEEHREVLRAYQDRCSRVVDGLSGHVAQYLGDGLLVYFGFPIAHEDAAERSVLAGLRILDEMADLNTELPHPVEVRVGVHTGPVVVGDVGGGVGRQRLALGVTPNIAARLQAVAEPGTVVISEATRHLVQGLFDCRDLGPHTLPGITRPIDVYRVMAQSETMTRFEVARARGLPALVGRDEEFHSLLRRWPLAVEGEGHVVMVSGEAGIGKSRLVQALRDRLDSDEVSRIEFRCSPHHRNTPLYPVIDYLERLLELGKGTSAREKLTRLEQAIASLRNLPEDALPLLSALLSLPHPKGFPELDQAPQLQRERTLDAIVAWLMEAAQNRPILNVWEDLHWADPSTLELLGMILERAMSGPMLSILTHRPEFEPPWQVGEHVSAMNLARLAESDVEAIVDHITGGAALPETVLAHIVAKTDGVPLFVEELTKTILESGVVRRSNGDFELSGPLDSLAIPETLQDSLMARLDGFGAAKEIAQLGATLGREFSYELTEAIAPISGDELDKALAILLDAELLLPSDGPDGRHFVFRHALIQDTAYESLLKSRRQQVHAQVARTLEERFPETVETKPEVLAHHYTEAGAWIEAVSYWQRAAEKSVERSANLEAVNQLMRALEIQRQLPESSERDLQELALQVALGAPLVAVRGYASADVADVFVRARELCEKLGDMPQLFAVLFRLRSYALVHGQIEEAHELGIELVRLGEQSADAGLQLEALYALGAALFYRGDMPETLEAFERMAVHYDPALHEAHAYQFGQEPGVALYSYQGWALAFLGCPELARQRMAAAVARAEEVGHPFSIAFVWAFKSLVDWALRDPAAAGASAQKAIAISQEYGFPIWIGIATPFLGWALAAGGEPEKGIGLVEQGIAAFKATGALVGVPHFQAIVGRACRETGDLQKGLDVVEEGLVSASGYEDRYYMAAELHREKGELLLAANGLDSADEAARCFERAQGISRRQGARMLELRAAASRVRLAQRLADGDGLAAARAELANVLTSVDECAEFADHREARALLDSATAAPSQ